MTLDEALRMAEVIRDHYQHLRIIAIGRFCALDQMETTPERWGVSVLLPSAERPRVLWSRDELLPLSRSDDRTPKKDPTERPTIESSREALLF